MIKYIIGGYLLYHLVIAFVGAYKDTKRAREIARLNAENLQRKEETRWAHDELVRQQAEALELARRQAAVEREQLLLSKEQAKQAKEQERQATQLAKHEKRIADLEFKVAQADEDIAFLRDRINQLDAQHDFLVDKQLGTMTGGSEYMKYQSKIISIENQLHVAENRLSKAQHVKEAAEKELSAA